MLWLSFCQWRFLLLNFIKISENFNIFQLSFIKRGHSCFSICSFLCPHSWLIWLCGLLIILCIFYCIAHYLRSERLFINDATFDLVIEQNFNLVLNVGVQLFQDSGEGIMDTILYLVSDYFIHPVDINLNCLIICHV